MKNHLKKKQGFTLAEAIVSVAIISILSIIIFPIIIRSIAVNRNSSNKTIATDRAVAKIEELRKKPFSSLTNGTHPFNISPLVLPSGAGEIIVTDDLNDNGTVDSDENDNIKKITVVIK